MEQNIKKYDVVALGELLIDFTPEGVSENGNVIFERNPGGAPANVLVALSKFGKKTSFIGKVGEDMFGAFLKNTLASYGVETKALLTTKECNTTLAFVALDENNDRSFSFYRNPGADLAISADEVDQDAIKNCKIFHFGSVSMTDEPARSATFHAVNCAKKEGALISYDPNLRKPLWVDEKNAERYIKEGLKLADIVKVSEEEAEFLFDTTDDAEAAKFLRDEYGIRLVMITKGAQGCYFSCGDYEGIIPAVKANVVDTTGAGDAFMAGVLNKLIDMEKNPEELTCEELEECIRFGTKSGSISTERKGGIPSMPTLEQMNG